MLPPKQQKIPLVLGRPPNPKQQKIPLVLGRPPNPKQQKIPLLVLGNQLLHLQRNRTVIKKREINR